MKNILKLLAITLICFSSANAQVMKFKLGGGGLFLLSQTEGSNNDSYGYHEYSGGEQELPSLHNLFDNDACFTGEVTFQTELGFSDRGRFLCGINFQKASFEAGSEEKGMYFGNNLNVMKFTPFIGYGVYTDYDEKVFFYGIIGVTNSSYEGEGNFSQIIEDDNNKSHLINFDGKYEYADGTAFRVGGGMDIDNFCELPITLGFQAGLELGKTDLENIKFSYKGKHIPTDEEFSFSDLHDNEIYLMATIGYRLDF